MNPKRIWAWIPKELWITHMLETRQWQYIHAPPCKPDSLPTSTNYRLNTSRLSTIKRNEHYLLMHFNIITKYLRVDTIDLFTNYVTRRGSLALVSYEAITFSTWHMAARLPGQESNHDVIMEKVHFTHSNSHEAMLSARSYIAYWLEKPSKYIASVFCSTLLLLGFAPVISNPHPRHLLSTSLLVSNDLLVY